MRVDVSVVNPTLLRLYFSAIFRTSLKIYSINNLTTAHAQSSQGYVQIIEGSYNQGCTVHTYIHMYITVFAHNART